MALARAARMLRLAIDRPFTCTPLPKTCGFTFDCISRSSMHSKEDVQFSTMKTTTTGSRIYISSFSHIFCPNTNFFTVGRQEIKG